MISQMLKKFIHEYGSSWDDLLPCLLFAIRTARNEATGYSPDELVFGRQLRTGLEVQRNSWENNDNAEETLKISAVDFVRELQQTVKTALEAASVNASSAHEKAKQYYDRQCKNRQLTENDLHRESKKQDTELLAITSPTIIRFSKCFHQQTL